MSIKKYGWDAVNLSRNLSLEELNELRLEVQGDPKNHNPEHARGTSIWIYTKSAQLKLDALAWAVTYKLAEKRRREAENK